MVYLQRSDGSFDIWQTDYRETDLLLQYIILYIVPIEYLLAIVIENSYFLTVSRINTRIVSIVSAICLLKIQWKHLKTVINLNY